jgi:hypothetical protein
MAIGGMLGHREFPVSSKEWHFRGLEVPVKQFGSWRKGMGV